MTERSMLAHDGARGLYLDTFTAEPGEAFLDVGCDEDGDQGATFVLDPERALRIASRLVAWASDEEKRRSALVAQEVADEVAAAVGGALLEGSRS